MSDDTLALTKALIANASVTPYDAGCQKLLAARLRPLGFEIESLRFGEVANLWATHGDSGPLFVFAGHTDVVPTGPLEDWHSAPFRPEERDGLLYGRGAADMKSSLAAMLVATENFCRTNPQHKGRLAFLLTSDEEGPARDGTKKVVEELSKRGEAIKWCLIGEPSCASRLGDTVRIGRRGSLNGTLTVNGTQGHVAYPELASNPVHTLAPALATLCATRLDDGNDFYPATTFQVSNIHAGTGAENIIPGTLTLGFNFRFSTEQTVETLKRQFVQALDVYSLDYTIDWRVSGLPFLTEGGELIAAVQMAVNTATGTDPMLSTGGGTSDGRFISPTGAEVVELGPVNTTIHKTNECVAVADLPVLARIYQHTVELLLGDH